MLFKIYTIDYERLAKLTKLLEEEYWSFKKEQTHLLYYACFSGNRVPKGFFKEFVKQKERFLLSPIDYF